MSQNEDLKIPPASLKPGEIEIQNAINLLIVKGYLLAAPDVGVLSISGQLNRFYRDNMSTMQKPQQTSILKQEERISLKDFKEKAEIPWQITTNKGTAKEFRYNVGQISLAAEKYFNSKVIGRVNMSTLIEVTKAFYKDETQARPTLTNFFLNGLWEDMLKNYKPKEEQRKTNNSLRL